MSINIIVNQCLSLEVVEWAKRYGEAADLLRKITLKLGELEKEPHP